MELIVNGEKVDVQDDLTLAALVRHLDLDRSACATEVNRQLVPRSAHESTRLGPGDVVEIVTLVGGG